MTNRGRMRRPHLLEDLPEGWSDRLLKPVGPGAHSAPRAARNVMNAGGSMRECTNIYQLTANLEHDPAPASRTRSRRSAARRRKMTWRHDVDVLSFGTFSAFTKKLAGSWRPFFDPPTGRRIEPPGKCSARRLNPLKGIRTS